ncbi:MAG TPA: VOC family protein [Chloroflexota bacterium]|jgi:hypothetical protein
MASHPIVHIEIPLPNPGTDSSFYAAALGWKLQTDPTYDYTQFTAEGGPGGGFVSTAPSSPMPGTIGKPLIYLATDDIDASLAAVEAHGGKTVQPKMEIPNVGWFARFTDPSGNQFAFFTPIPRG